MYHDDPPPADPRGLRRALRWGIPFGIAFYTGIAAILLKVCS